MTSTDVVDVSTPSGYRDIGLSGYWLSGGTDSSSSGAWAGRSSCRLCASSWGRSGGRRPTAAVPRPCPHGPCQRRPWFRRSGPQPSGYPAPAGSAALSGRSQSRPSTIRRDDVLERSLHAGIRTRGGGRQALRVHFRTFSPRRHGLTNPARLSAWPRLAPSSGAPRPRNPGSHFLSHLDNQDESLIGWDPWASRRPTSSRARSTCSS
jgi:hypothetical protein